MCVSVHQTLMPSARARCSRFPGSPVYAAGYSLGALILAKYLSEADQGWYSHQASEEKAPVSSIIGSSGSKVPALGGSGLEAAALVSSPICFSNALRNLSEPWTLRYAYNLSVAFK
jgi:predicted alpha/beta-fold hydrolase